MEASVAQAKLEAGVGAVLMTAPVWYWLLHDISMIASAVASVCGAVVGLHAVWRLRKHHKQ